MREKFHLLNGSTISYICFMDWPCVVMLTGIASFLRHSRIV